MKKGLLIGILLLCGRVVWAAEDNTSWAETYRQVQEAYVDKVSVEDLAVAALKGLDKSDKQLRFANDGSRISLYYKGQVIKVLNKPQDTDDFRRWGEMTQAMLEAAIDKSAEAASRDFEMEDLLAESLVKVLDKDSKFYISSDEAVKTGQGQHRVFAARREGNLLYVKIGMFNKQTVADVTKALTDEKEASALVLDLRGCPGGMASEAIEVADLFLDGGIITILKGKNPREETYYTAHSPVLWGNKPMFVLVDAETASAAEILATALQEEGRAQIIGTATIGKGTMQKLIALSGGGVLAVTNGRFAAPSGKEINERGVIPDVCTFEMPENKDIEELLKRKPSNCLAEPRAESNLELKIAEYIQKM
jgi:uncharacterized metal-binding protein